MDWLSLTARQLLTIDFSKNLLRRRFSSNSLGKEKQIISTSISRDLYAYMHLNAFSKRIVL